MRYDLMAPPALLDAAAKSEESGELGVLLATRDPRQEPRSSKERAANALRYAMMWEVALRVVKQASIRALGQLDGAIAADGGSMTLEDALGGAQEALDATVEEGAQFWSEGVFARELAARGFSLRMAQEHAHAFGALLDPGADTPEGLKATMEIRLDEDGERMNGAALYLERRGARKIAVADIQWTPTGLGPPTPQAEITVASVH
jgi:hypothetical protein